MGDAVENFGSIDGDPFTVPLLVLSTVRFVQSADDDD
jgi:hypothetical protein